MTILQMRGHLTGYIEQGEPLSLAQKYLQDDDMTQYLEDDLKVKVERIRWYLEPDGHSWYVEAITRMPLEPAELKELSDWVSGQNSDGLGESFEQQPFAEQHDGECGECDSCIYGYSCDDSYTGMISFDWETNKHEWVEV